MYREPVNHKLPYILCFAPLPEVAEHTVVPPSFKIVYRNKTENPFKQLKGFSSEKYE